MPSKSWWKVMASQVVTCFRTDLRLWSVHTYSQAQKLASIGDKVGSTRIGAARLASRQSGLVSRPAVTNLRLQKLQVLRAWL